MKKLVAFAAAAVAFAAPAVAAAADCEQVKGDFVANVVPCAGPFCTAGTLIGDVDATYSFAMTSANPTPTGLIFEGASTITTGDGQLFGSDHGAINFATGGFVTVVKIDGGTGANEGAFGVIVATGSLTHTGTAGTYTGVICTP